MDDIESGEGEIESPERSQIGGVEVVEPGLKPEIARSLEEEAERGPERPLGFVVILSGPQSVPELCPGAGLPIGRVSLVVPAWVEVGRHAHRETGQFHHLLGALVANVPTPVQEGSQHSHTLKADLRPVDERLEASSRFEQGGHPALADVLTTMISLAEAESREEAIQRLVVGSRGFRGQLGPGSGAQTAEERSQESAARAAPPEQMACDSFQGAGRQAPFRERFQVGRGGVLAQLILPVTQWILSQRNAPFPRLQRNLPFRVLLGALAITVPFRFT